MNLTPRLNSAEDAGLGPIEEIAADWMIRRDRGLTTAQRADLERWLHADARHAAVFSALEETWRLMGEAGRAKEPRRRVPFAVWWPLGLAAAAALAIASLSWWRPAPHAGTDYRVSFATTAATEVGGQRTLNLPDGSVVHLNTDTRIAVLFSSAERNIHLARGEAHFTVAKDNEHPFVVTTSDVQVRAVGTAFNVRLSAKAVEVLVTEGRVRVDNPTVARASLEAEPSTPLVVAGQKLTVPLQSVSAQAAVPMTLPPTELKQALAWQQQRIDFESARLADMVAEFNRYSRHQLVIADPRLESRLFGGSFPAGDHETFVRLLESNFGVIAERGNGITRLRLAQ